MSKSKAYFYLIKILSSRDYSEHKLREKLRERKYPAIEIDEVINEIKEKGYLKEDLYTEARIKGFMHKGYPPKYIRQKLAQEQLTVSEDVIMDVFVEHRVSVEEQIERLVRKKLPKIFPIEYEAQNKILRFLMSKGHDFSQSKKIMVTIINETTN